MNQDSRTRSKPFRSGPNCQTATLHKCANAKLLAVDLSGSSAAPVVRFPVCHAVRRGCVRFVCNFRRFFSALRPKQTARLEAKFPESVQQSLCPFRMLVMHTRVRSKLAEDITFRTSMTLRVVFPCCLVRGDKLCILDRTIPMTPNHPVF